jgi:hypothetical protein
MGFSLGYCDKCKEDMHRMDMGYNPINGNCGRWQCYFLDIIKIPVFLILGILLIIPLLIFMICICIHDLVVGNKYAIQEQSDEKVVYEGLGRKKSRKSRMVSHTVARSKSRSKKRTR